MYIGTQHQVFGTVVKCHLEHLPPGLSSGFTNSNPYGSPGLSSRLHLGPAQGGCRHLGTEASDKRPVYVCLFLLPPSLSFSSLSLPPSSLTYKKKTKRNQKVQVLHATLQELGDRHNAWYGETVWGLFSELLQCSRNLALRGKYKKDQVTGWCQAVESKQANKSKGKRDKAKLREGALAWGS